MSLKKIPCLWKEPGKSDVEGATISRNIHLAGVNHELIVLYRGRVWARKGTAYPRTNVMLCPMGVEQGLLAPGSVVAVCTIRHLCHADLQREVGRLNKIVLDKDLQLMDKEGKIEEYRQMVSQKQHEINLLKAQKTISK